MDRAASYFLPDDMKTLSSLYQFLVSVGAVKKTLWPKKATTVGTTFVS
jgi:preprotein translocase subunit SecE